MVAFIVLNTCEISLLTEIHIVSEKKICENTNMLIIFKAMIHPKIGNCTDGKMNHY